MLNLLTFMLIANNEFILLSDYGVRRDLLYDLANRCGFKVIERTKKGQKYFRLKKVNIPCERLYTRSEKNTFNYVDIADLHIGHPDCDINKLKIFLESVALKGIDYVFIAGDIFEGIPDIEREHLRNLVNNKTKIKSEFERQLDIAYRLFRNIPLNIMAIPGNHDFTFDFLGINNPLKKLEGALKSEECNFKAYDSYIQDFEIAGVVKRMMHLEHYFIPTNVYPAIHRLYEFAQNDELMSRCVDGVKRPVRFLHCGHIHKMAELYDSEHMIFVSQPGSFIKGQNFYMPYINVKGEVLEDLRVLRS